MKASVLGEVLTDVPAGPPVAVGVVSGAVTRDVTVTLPGT